jgi:hypothetical protein
MTSGRLLANRSSFGQNFYFAGSMKKRPSNQTSQLVITKLLYWQWWLSPKGTAQGLTLRAQVKNN